MINNRVIIFKICTFILSLLPLFWCIYLGFTSQLGIDPIDYVVDYFGQVAINFLVLAMLVSIVSKWRLSFIVRIRRMIGLFVFFYATVHMLCYLFLFLGTWDDLIEALSQQSYIIVGMMAWLILLILSVTSNNYSQRLLRRNWKRLHRLVYLCAILVVIHYIWLSRADLEKPVVYLIVFLVLLGSRTVIYKVAIKFINQAKNYLTTLLFH